MNIHTPCSQPLAAGDVFGSLELVQINGQGAGAGVTYLYDVTNMGKRTVVVTGVNDGKLGKLLASSNRLGIGAIDRLFGKLQRSVKGRLKTSPSQK